MDHLVPIGQFSKLTWLSSKALRRYADSGLLPPARIDPDTGYRYYRLSQVERARVIRLLRMTDMSLAAISRTSWRIPIRRRCWRTSGRWPRKQAARERVLHYLYRLFPPAEVKMAQSTCSSDTVFDVKMKEVPALAFVSRSATVSLGELAGFISDSIRNLSAEQTPAGRPFTLFHGPLNEDTDGPVEVCVPVEATVAGRELPACPVAYTVVEGPQTQTPEIMAAFDAVAVWAKQQGHELVAAPREIYHTDVDAAETQRWEINWPVR